MGSAGKVSDVILTAAVAAIPVVGGPVAVVTQALLGTRRRRLESYSLEVARGLTEEQVQDLEDLLAHDDGLQDLLLNGIQMAARTRHDTQRRILAGILADAIRAPEDVDILEPLQEAVGDLLPAHGRLLRLFADRPPLEPILETDLRAYEPELAPVIDELLARLVRTGIIKEPPVLEIDGGSVGQVVEDNDATYVLTDFGRRLLNYVRE